MDEHQRKLIRDVLIALLISANTAAGARVRSTRVDPYKKTGLPALAVYTLNEQTDHDLSDQSAPRELTRELSAELVGTVGGPTETAVQDAMDALAKQVETAMDANRYLAVAFDVTAVDPITDQLTVVGHRLSNGAAPATLSSSAALPGGATPSAEYYVIVIDDDHLQLARTNADALNGDAVDLTSAGGGALQLIVSMAVDSILDSTVMEVDEGNGSSDPLVGFVALTYTVKYRTQPAAPRDLADFTAVDAKYLLVGGVPDTHPAEDTFNPRTP